MPSASHPRAQFVPISPDFDLNALVENTDNFDFVTRLSVEKLKEHSVQSFEALVLAVVIQSGKPLVIEDWGADSIPPSLFSREWLEENRGTVAENVRDIPNGVNIPMTIGHYLRSMGQLTKQFTSSTYRDSKRQRLYLKDIDCPDAWSEKLKEVLPDSIFYLNECIESRLGGDGSIREPNEYGQMRYGKGVAPAGDLMSSLPPEMRALNMMCYIGHEGTYTPAHREMCASLGQNIMVEASKGGNGEKEGSSIWFMTETKEREVVSEYFLSMLGHDIEVEKHFAQVNAWKKAPFNVWVVEQRPGDLILIPPLAPHQVWNRGTRTMKVAWNRTTVDTLELAIHEALPRGVMVCRDEQYKNKAIIYYTLQKYHDLLQRDTIEPKMWKYGRIKQLLDDFKRLFSLYTENLVSEMFSPKLPEETDIEYLPYDSNVTCSYCRCNIFNRFLTCKSCILGDNGEDAYDICMDCYAMGRSCGCISSLNWCEQWPWATLMEHYDQWRNVVVVADGHFDIQRSPQPLDIARKRYGKKPIAEVCQEQLKLRPWTDITKPEARQPSPGMSDVEPEVDDNGRLKKSKKGRPSRRGRVVPVKNKTHTCHVCCHHEWNWKLAFCSTCDLAYCYGVLWRAFDLMPQTVMEDKEWQCPRCLKICSCGKCRKGGKQKPYEPKGTLLGHDTKRVADHRSVESLVDFSKTNLTWLRGDEDESPHKSSRMRKLKEKAEAEKEKDQQKTINEAYIDETQQDPFLGAPVQDEMPANMDEIDPALRDSNDFTASNGHANDFDNFFDQDPAISGNDEPNNANGDGLDHTRGWMDAHYNLDDYDVSYHNQSANYPSRLFAPVVPMFRQEEHEDSVGQPRMMGVGYYQQADNGVDQILYDAPNSGDEAEESQPVAPYNLNLGFTDIIPSYSAPTQSGQKRKRFGERIGSGDDEDDMEYFTSKSQRKKANTRKEALIKSDVAPMPIPRDSTQRQPRRSAVKPTIYTDLGEDAVPIEDDEGPSAVSTYKPPKAKNEDDQLADWAEKAMSRLANPENDTPKPIVPRKRRKPRIQDTTRSASPKPQPKPRKSAWLARKEAEESGNDFPEELPPRTRRSLTHKEKSTAMTDARSDSLPNDDSFETDSLFGEPITREKSVYQSDDEFIPARTQKQGGEVALETNKNLAEDSELEQIYSPVKWRASKDDASVELAEVDTAVKPTPRRRGRPPKKAVATVVSPFRSLSPAIERPAKMLSLREKLALKGKKVKIVASKTRKSIEKTPGLSKTASTPFGPHQSSSSPRTSPSEIVPRSSSARSTPSVAIPAFSNMSPASIASPEMLQVFEKASSKGVASNAANSGAQTPASVNLADEAMSMPASRAVSSAPSQTVRSSSGMGNPPYARIVEKSPGLPNRATVSLDTTNAVRLSDGDIHSPKSLAAIPTPPARKGPTIVRLNSPSGLESGSESRVYTSDEPETTRYNSKLESPIDDGSSSDSDASIPAHSVSQQKATRGRGRGRGAYSNSVGSLRGRAVRGRPRGRPTIQR